MKGSRCSFPPYFTDFKNFYYPSSPATSSKVKVWETLILSVFPIFFSTKFLLKYRVETCRPHKYWVFWSGTVSKRCFFCHDFEYNAKGGKRKFRKHVLCCL